MKYNHIHSVLLIQSLYDISFMTPSALWNCPLWNIIFPLKTFYDERGKEKYKYILRKTLKCNSWIYFCTLLETRNEYLFWVIRNVIQYIYICNIFLNLLQFASSWLHVLIVTFIALTLSLLWPLSVEKIIAYLRDQNQHNFTLVCFISFLKFY